MFDITLTTLVPLFFISFSLNQTYVNEPCFRYLNDCTIENGCKECGIQPKTTSKKDTSRIINGEPSGSPDLPEHIYPWMVQIQLTVATIPHSGAGYWQYFSR